jgi:hypothetical protein
LGERHIHARSRNAKAVVFYLDGGAGLGRAAVQARLASLVDDASLAAEPAIKFRVLL